MTPKQIIDRCGGAATVAKALDVSTSAVYNWQKRGLSELARYKIARRFGGVFAPEEVERMLTGEGDS